MLRKFWYSGKGSFSSFRSSVCKSVHHDIYYTLSVTTMVVTNPLISIGRSGKLLHPTIKLDLLVEKKKVLPLSNAGDSLGKATKTLPTLEALDGQSSPQPLSHSVALAVTKTKNESRDDIKDDNKRNFRSPLFKFSSRPFNMT